MRSKASVLIDCGALHCLLSTTDFGDRAVFVRLVSAYSAMANRSYQYEAVDEHDQ
jgi:hypothetical protein